MIQSRTARERLAHLERIFRALPEVQVEGAQHRSFSIRKKRLAYYLNDHHGDGTVALAVKTTPGDRDHYIEFDPKRFFLPAYIGPRGFVGFRLDQASIDWKEVEALARSAYRLQAPKTLVARLDAPPATRSASPLPRSPKRPGAGSLSTLERRRQPMPAFVRRALGARGLLSAYAERPPYQRNDYLSWINRAKRDETKQRRLARLLDELAAGNRYMGMKHGVGRRT